MTQKIGVAILSCIIGVCLMANAEAQVTGTGTPHYLAIWNGSTSLYSPVESYVSGSQLSIGPNDANAGYPLGGAIPTTMLVQALGAQNALIGEIDNNVAYSVTPFLAVGVTGYGKVPSGTASVAFGLYGLGELKNTLGAVVGGEVTARNFSGAPASTGVPPPLGAPSTNTIADGWHITCGTTPPDSGATYDCSTGLYISNESGGDLTKASFANGEIIHAYRNFGLYVMAGDTGSTSALLENPGSGVNLEIKTTGTMAPTNAVMTVNDHLGAVQAALYQNGSIAARNITSTAPSSDLNLTIHSTGTMVATNAVMAVTDNSNVVHASIYQNGDIHLNNITALGPGFGIYDAQYGAFLIQQVAHATYVGEAGQQTVVQGATVQFPNIPTSTGGKCLGILGGTIYISSVNCT